MKTKAAAHGTTSKYTLGCRCEPCKEARRTYQREYYAKHPRPPRVVKSYWSSEEFARRRGEKEVRWAALDACDPCIRCDLRGSGYPLCTVCVAELRGQRVTVLDASTYVENAIPILVEVIRNGYRDGYVEKEHRWMLEDVHRELQRLDGGVDAAIGGRITPAQLNAWRESYVDFLGHIVEVLPVR